MIAKSVIPISAGPESGRGISVAKTRSTITSGPKCDRYAQPACRPWMEAGNRGDLWVFSSKWATGFNGEARRFPPLSTESHSLEPDPSPLWPEPSLSVELNAQRLVGVGRHDPNVAESLPIFNSDRRAMPAARSVKDPHGVAETMLMSLCGTGGSPPAPGAETCFGMTITPRRHGRARLLHVVDLAPAQCLALETVSSANRSDQRSIWHGHGHHPVLNWSKLQASERPESPYE